MPGGTITGTGYRSDVLASARARDEAPDGLPLARVATGGAIGAAAGLGIATVIRELGSAHGAARGAGLSWALAGAGALVGGAVALATEQDPKSDVQEHRGGGAAAGDGVSGGVDGAVRGQVSGTGDVDPAALADKPNVVLVVTDDQTLDQIKHAMPYLNGHDDWVTFDNASLNTSLCCPSRATILSGQYSHHTGIEYLEGWKFRDGSTLATWLQDAGYTTGLYGKYLNSWLKGRPENDIPPGWDEWHSFIRSAYYDYDVNDNGTITHHGHRPDDYSTEVLADKASDFIRGQAGGDNPFFLYFTPYGAHSPRTPAPQDEGAFDGVRMRRPPNFNEHDVSDKPGYIADREKQDPHLMDEERRDGWETSLSVDRAVQQLFTTLRETGEDRDTVVIFMTDNGYAFGEHRWNSKRTPYEESTQTPLLMRIPGVSGRRVEAPVSNADIASTIADIADITPGIGQDGQSMLPLVYGIDEDWREGVLLHFAGGSAFRDRPGEKKGVTGYWGIRTPDLKYLEYLTGEREFYDLRRDPYELDNRIDAARYRDDVVDLRRTLHRMMHGDLRDPSTLPTLETHRPNATGTGVDVLG